MSYKPSPCPFCRSKVTVRATRKLYAGGWKRELGCMGCNYRAVLYFDAKGKPCDPPPRNGYGQVKKALEEKPVIVPKPVPIRYREEDCAPPWFSTLPVAGCVSGR